jgi:hypothetical protein
MSSEEQQLILAMVADKTITIEEAAGLLDALDEQGLQETIISNRVDGVEMSRAQRLAAREEAREARRVIREQNLQNRELERMVRDHERNRRRVGFSRSLRIRVRDGEDTRTDIRIPLGMALATTKFIPQKARLYFEDFGIELGQILASIASNGARCGDIVNIRDGEKSIYIGIEGDDDDDGSVQIAVAPPTVVEPPMPPQVANA